MIATDNRVVTVNRAELVSALKLCKAVISKRGTLPILSNVKLTRDGDGLTLLATDLDTSVRVNCGTSSDAHYTDAAVWATTVNGAQLLATVSARKGGTVRLTLSGDQFLVDGASMATIDAAEFPRVAVADAEDVTTLNAGEFVGALAFALVAASQNEASPVLTGLLVSPVLTSVEVAATDRHRLHVASLRLTGAQSFMGAGFILPRKAAKLVIAAFGKSKGGLTVTAGRRSRVEFRSDGSPVRIVSRVIEGDYPNYRQVIPEDRDARVTVDSADLMAVLAQAKPFACDAAIPVRLFAQEGTVTVSAETAEAGSFTADIDATYSRTYGGTRVALNLAYAVDTLKAIGSAKVVIGLSGALQPIRIDAAPDNGRVAVIMPVRIPS